MPNIAPPAVIDPSQWRDVTDEQLRQFASSGFSRPGYQIPGELLNDVRASCCYQRGQCGAWGTAGAGGPAGADVRSPCEACLRRGRWGLI